MCRVMRVIIMGAPLLCSAITLIRLSDGSDWNCLVSAKAGVILYIDGYRVQKKIRFLDASKKINS